MEAVVGEAGRKPALAVRQGAVKVDIYSKRA
jgi:hypothetical protein